MGLFPGDRRVGCWILATLCMLPAWGEDDWATDRPDFVESSATVGRGVFQIEAGAAFERMTGDGRVEESLASPTLLRLGVAERWEARVETDGLVRVRVAWDGTSAREVTHSGVADVSLGVKHAVLDGGGRTARPSVAWLAHADLDTGSAAFRGHGVRPSIRVSAEWQLSERLGFGAMPGLVYDARANGDRYASGIFAAVLGHAWSERGGAFVELAARQIARRRDGGTVVTLDSGLTWRPRRHWQVDVAVSLGIGAESPDFGGTVGVSKRF